MLATRFCCNNQRVDGSIKMGTINILSYIAQTTQNATVRIIPCRVYVYSTTINGYKPVYGNNISKDLSKTILYLKHVQSIV